MEVCRRDFPEMIQDNDEMYIRHLCAVIESVDELSCMNISITPHSYHFRIAPSIPKYIEPILGEILKLNNLYKIKLNLSKSMKASSTITFDVEIQNN